MLTGYAGGFSGGEPGGISRSSGLVTARSTLVATCVCSARSFPTWSVQAKPGSPAHQLRFPAGAWRMSAAYAELGIIGIIPSSRIMPSIWLPCSEKLPDINAWLSLVGLHRSALSGLSTRRRSGEQVAGHPVDCSADGWSHTRRSPDGTPAVDEPDFGDEELCRANLDGIAGQSRSSTSDSA